MEPSCIHIVIADDHSIVREGLSAVIHREPGMEVIAEACNWPEAVDKVVQHRPEIAVLDLHMRGMEPADGIAAIRRGYPAARMIVYSAFSTDEEVFQVFSAGARGYVLKGESGREDLLAMHPRRLSRGNLGAPAGRGTACGARNGAKPDSAGDRCPSSHGGRQIQQGNRIVPSRDGGNGEGSRQPYPRQTRRGRARRGHRGRGSTRIRPPHGKPPGPGARRQAGQWTILFLSLLAELPALDRRRKSGEAASPQQACKNCRQSRAHSARSLASCAATVRQALGRSYFIVKLAAPTLARSARRPATRSWLRRRAASTSIFPAQR